MLILVDGSTAKGRVNWLSGDFIMVSSISQVRNRYGKNDPLNRRKPQFSDYTDILGGRMFKKLYSRGNYSQIKLKAASFFLHSISSFCCALL